MPQDANTPKSLPFTRDSRADRYLVEDPLALLIGMVLDQQVPLEKAFAGPWVLRQRLGAKLDAAKIAAMAPGELTALFVDKPALHRFPASMAARVQDLCRLLVDEYGGDAAAVWRTAATGDELLKRVKALPGFGEQKARIFVALLGKQLGVRPSGWEKAAGPFGRAGSLASVADIDSPGALVAVREHKRAMKASAATAGQTSRSAGAKQALEPARSPRGRRTGAGKGA
ncbi:MAG: HhH-GPD-type base excision DNA repair protein [Acidimicrobiales bacterium]|jgi:uncharacterized HhH-GPD family protein